jgi:hypothetical protein
MTSSAQPSWLVWHENDIPALGSALDRIAGKAGRAAQSSGLRGSARHRHGRRSLAKPVGARPRIACRREARPASEARHTSPLLCLAVKPQHCEAGGA